MATELTSVQQPVLIHHGDEQGRLLGDHHHTAVPGHGVPGHHVGVPGHTTHGVTGHHGVPVASVPVLVGAVPVVQGYAVPQQAGVHVPKKHGPLKPLLALLLLSLGAVLLGLLAYQAHNFFGGWLFGGYDTNSTETANNDGGVFGGPLGFVGVGDNYYGNGYNENSYNNGYNNYWGSNNVGFNGAGTGMWFFGLLFAVLTIVTAITMWIHLAYYFPYLRHSSVMAPLKVTAAVGFIAMGFAARHISLGARTDTSDTHRRVTHAIEAFIIINWFIVMLVLLLSLVKKEAHWDCDNLEEHRITRRMTAGYTQFWLAVILIGLISAYFQLYTGRYLSLTSAVEMLLVFGIMFAVLQLISGVAMIQQCGYNAPGQLPETVHALLKVVIAFGVIAFGFACRSIYLSTHSYGNYDTGLGNNYGNNYQNGGVNNAAGGNNLGNNFGNNYGGNGLNNALYNNGLGGRGQNTASPHLISIQSFIIINFIVSLWLTWASSHGTLNWDNYNTKLGPRKKGMIFGVLQLIFSIILFGMLAGILQGLTGNEPDSYNSINIAGKYMIWFGLLFAVLEFFAGCTMLESGTKKLGGLNPSSVSVVNKVALALGGLAFGFACRHINIHRRYDQSGPREALVHAIEAFIIINFFLTWLIDIMCVRGMIEW